MSRYSEIGLLDKIKNLYTSGVSIEEISKEFNISERSLITKLALEGIYRKKPYLNKLGKIPVKKRDLIDKISKELGLLEGQDACLEQCTKLVLEKLVEKLHIDARSASGCNLQVQPGLLVDLCEEYW